MGLLDRIIKAAVAVIAAVAISPVIITGAHADEHNDGGGGGNVTLPGGLPIQTDFKMMMNYELGMHCTGFEFAYCCVLPVYNSILAQVVKPESNRNDFPRLLEADPRENTTADVLGRHTVLRDPAELDRDDNFQKYVLRYWHDAQPRNDGNGKPQTSTLISNVEGNSLLSWNTVADSANIVDSDGNRIGPCTYDADGNPIDYNLGAMETGDYNGSENVVVGDGDYTEKGCTFGVEINNYQNVVWNHLYIKEVSARGVEGYGGNTGGNSPENLKYRLGIHVDYPTNFGPAGHGMEGLLTFSGDHGTVVFTQMKVLEDLPITLTSPRIWEALGLPLTPFEDSIDFFTNPGLVDEDSVRPYVEMKAQLYHADCDGAGNCTEGDAVLSSGNNPVIGFGTAPIDIPNCERCHSAFDSPNSPNVTIGGTPEEIAASALVQQEMDFWLAYYPSMQVPGNSDWYARLKGAAVSILSTHDIEHGTSFLAEYPGNVCTNGLDDCDGGPLTILDPNGDGNPGAGTVIGFAQNTRAGHESVICQKCHADNVIAVVKSANCGPDQNCDVDDPRNQLFSNIAPGSMLIPPLTEAIHWNHREVSEGGPIDFQDAQGRSGGCQGCHPAHRSDGDMEGYPIDLDGNNFYADSDNRDANGGCFVGRDVHSNPMKDIDGAETPEHLNPVGEWLSENVFNDQNSVNGGLWCTNCHTQAGQQMWKAENVADLVNAQPGDAGHVREPGDITGDDVQDLNDVLAAVNASLGTSTDINQFKSWLDPKGKKCSDTGKSCYVDGDCDGAGATCDALSADGIDYTSAIWTPDPGMCNHAASLLGLADASPYQDGNVATIEIAIGSTDGSECSTNGVGLPGPSCLGEEGGAPSFYICGSLDDDNDVNVSLRAGGIRDSDGSFCTPPVDPETDPGCVAQSPFCTTEDCVDAAQFVLAEAGFTTAAVPVPMSAATDARDHWLAPGEPHCADCHEAPYVEQSGNVNAFAPFNYPRKASLMRYSRGHQDITCQGCHESTHGLYPVTPTIDTTSYAQAASLNDDNSHGPLKCGACHDTNSRGVWDEADDLRYNGQRISRNLDAAISWMHTFTEEADPRVDFCQNCHDDETDEMRSRRGEWEEEWLEHARRGRASRSAMDKVEILEVGHVAGDPAFEDPLDTVCVGCHSDESDEISCDRSDGREWKEHLTEGRVSMSVWEYVSLNSPGTDNSTCGW